MTRNRTVAALFAAIAVYFFVYSFQYSIGSASRMGPAYFPIMTSVSLFAVAVCIWLFENDHVPARFEWDIFSAGVPIGAILVFAVNLVFLGCTKE